MLFQSNINYVPTDNIVGVYKDTSENFFQRKMRNTPDKEKQSLDTLLKTGPLMFLTKRGNMFFA